MDNFKYYLEILAAFITVFGFGGIVLQLYWQKKKDRTELILKLYADFFHNSKYMSVFKILDSDSLSECNNSIRKIIEGGEIKSVDGKPIEGVEEIDLNSYMNFFNSLAILEEEGIVEQSDIMKLFRYQLERTFASIEMLRYMEDYGFERIKSILPQGFFFYGTLKAEKDRDVLKDISAVNHFLKNGKEVELKKYKIEVVGSNGEYKGLVKSNGNGTPPVQGSYVRIQHEANWTKLFEVLDEYEEVGELYQRSIIQVNNKSRFVWTYLKK